MDFWIIFIAMNFFNQMDALLTWLGINKFGAKEKNPLVAKFMKKGKTMSTNVLLIVKIIIPIPLGLLMVFTEEIVPLIIYTCYFALICFWNVSMLLFVAPRRIKLTQGDVR